MAQPDGAAAAAAASARQIAELLAQFERTLRDMSDTCYALAPDDRSAPLAGWAGAPLRPRPRLGGQAAVPASLRGTPCRPCTSSGAAIQGSARLCLSARGTLVSIADRAWPRASHDGSGELQPQRGRPFIPIMPALKRQVRWTNGVAPSSRQMTTTRVSASRLRACRSI